MYVTISQLRIMFACQQLLCYQSINLSLQSINSYVQHLSDLLCFEGLHEFAERRTPGMRTISYTLYAIQLNLSRFFIDIFNAIWLDLRRYAGMLLRWVWRSKHPNFARVKFLQHVQNVPDVVKSLSSFRQKITAYKLKVLDIMQIVYKYFY